MAFTVEVAKTTLLEQGFLDWRNKAIGDSIQGMEEMGFKFLSEYGLDLCEQHILNTDILSIVESFFGGETCILAHCLRYIEYPGHILCFRKGGPLAGRRVLGIQLLARGSRIDYYSGSHHHHLPTINGKRFLYEISKSSMDEVGCPCEEKEFPDGGLTIFDARIGFELKEGYAITFEFATADIIETRHQIILPNLPKLVQKVEDMRRSLVNLNFHKILISFVFKDPKPYSKRSIIA